MNDIITFPNEEMEENLTTCDTDRQFHNLLRSVNDCVNLLLQALTIT